MQGDRVLTEPTSLDSDAQKRGTLKTRDWKMREQHIWQALRAKRTKP